MSTHILVVEDDPSQRKMLSLLIKRKLEMVPVEAKNGLNALALLRKDTLQTIKLIILDINMPEMNGLEFLDIVTQQYPDLPVIMLTGTDDMNTAIKAMKMGAYDFLRKPLESDRFQVSARNAIKLSSLKKEITALKTGQKREIKFDDLIGHDTGLLSSITKGKKAAASNVPVLITGETGVGKEMFARALHEESTRKNSPFIAINCGAIPESLVESTLFGHEKGAFTGAVSKAIGCFREAEGGTIFLDEIGDLPLEAQVKLLRVLQQKEVHPVGLGKPIPVNARIISATNRNLENDVLESIFRRDLYFRLNVISIDIPSLRDRSQDIPSLVHHFVDKFSVENKKEPKKVAPKVLDKLSKQAWIGNIRELENMIQRALVMSENSILGIDDFIQTTQIEKKDKDLLLNNQMPILKKDGKLKTMKQIEKEALSFSLAVHKQNITQAALSLGIAKSTFYRKLKQYNITENDPIIDKL